MPAHRYVEENSSAAMLATKRSAGVTPEVNFRECVICTPLQSAIKVVHSGFETHRRHRQKSKTGVSVAHKKMDREISHFKYNSKHFDKCKFPLKLIKILTVFITFSSEVVQKCQHCQLCV